MVVVVVVVDSFHPITQITLRYVQYSFLCKCRCVCVIVCVCVCVRSVCISFFVCFCFSLLVCEESKCVYIVWYNLS